MDDGFGERDEELSLAQALLSMVLVGAMVVVIGGLLWLVTR